MGNTFRIFLIALTLSLTAFEFNAGAHEAVAIGDPNLENAHRLTPKVLTGAEPHGERAFEALQALGVKTVISVDGAKPDAELAAKFGLRYVHLPIGYDGVSIERGRELAKAITELDGPIYVHCHHGKHRGPAAAVVACVVADAIKNDEAIAAMKKLGTGENYLGLWESARTAKPVPADELKKINVEFRASSPIPPLADAMVKVDEIFEHLSDMSKNGWKPAKEHPDADAAHEALKLGEIFTELQRTDEHKQRPAEYKEWMIRGAEHAAALEKSIREFKTGSAQANEKVLEGALNALQSDCKGCHKTYRNVKAAK